VCRGQGFGGSRRACDPAGAHGRGSRKLTDEFGKPAATLRWFLEPQDFDALDRWARRSSSAGAGSTRSRHAGVAGRADAARHLEPRTFEELLDVNVTANWRLLRSLDPCCAAPKRPGVFLTSGVARSTLRSGAVMR